MIDQLLAPTLSVHLFQAIGENIRGEKRTVENKPSKEDSLLEFPLLDKLKETLRLSSSEVKVYYSVFIVVNFPRIFFLLAHSTLTISFG